VTKQESEASLSNLSSGEILITRRQTWYFIIWPQHLAYGTIQKFNILSSLTVYFRFLTLTLPLCVLYFRFLTCILWVGPLTLLFHVFFFWLLNQLFNILSKSQKPKYLWVVGLVQVLHYTDKWLANQASRK
jgi:hypothetical protein